ncbi:P1 family peptidase, partial [Paracoccus sp. PXZ]
EGGITVGALVVVNALGSVTAGETRQFWAAPWELGGEFGGLGLSGPYPAAHEPSPMKRLGEATTIAIVATDAALDKAGLTRLATAAQDGMARAIVPSHTPFDGDLVFAVSTGARPLPDPALTPFQLGHAAACTLARAIARGVHAASPRPGDLQPCWREG